MSKLSKRFHRLCCLALVISLLLPACSPRPLDIVEDGIQEMERQPDRWEEVLKNTIDRLEKTAGKLAKDLLNEVSSVYRSALGQTLVTGFCGADFIENRISQRLKAILYKYDKSRPKQLIVPVVCMTDPEYIDAGKTMVVKYYGYDFLKFKEQSEFTIDVRYKSTGRTIPEYHNNAYINVRDNYFLLVEIQSLDFRKLDRTGGPQIVLKWEGDEVDFEGVKQSELAIVVEPTLPPTPVPRRKITVQGRIEIKDDDWPGSDDHGTLIIDETNAPPFLLIPGTDQYLSFDKCVGGEVRVELNIKVSLQVDQTANALIEARLFEGTNCSTDDREDKVEESVIAGADGIPGTWSHTLRNTENNGGDWAKIDLTFMNTSP